MALTAAAAAAASAVGGVHAVFSYNRENFKYDREMRQRCEFKVLDFRAKQAGMWREDIRDLIGMTENRMNRYLIMTTIQLGMVLGMFTEGRLEAGTPQWLLRFYMLSLGSSFMYLLMSVWLAMHASVLAQTSGTRLLTQFVRLPIPTWQHIDKMRTYGASFETLGANMVRVPFVNSPDPAKSTWNKTGVTAWASAPPGDPIYTAHLGTPAVPKSDDKLTSGTSSEQAKPSWEATGGVPRQQTTQQDPNEAEEDNHFDVWGLEANGNEIDELQPKAPADRAHIGMVRDEALHWQCHDLFARVTMTMGTNHLVFSIIYYCLGYLSIQDGAPMPSWCVAALMLCTGVTLVFLDFIIPPEDMKSAIALIITGPSCVALTTFLMAARSPNVGTAYTFCLPTAYLAHAGWLFWALQALGIEKHPNGAWLPMKFRPMHYLDVFGWYHGHFKQASEQGAAGAASDASKPDFTFNASEAQSFEPARTFLGARPGKVFKLGGQGLGYYRDFDPMRRKNDIMEAHARGDSVRVKETTNAAEFHLGTSSAAGLPAVSGEVIASSDWVKMRGTTDTGTELPYFYNEKTGDIRSDMRAKSMDESGAFRSSPDSKVQTSRPSAALAKDEMSGSSDTLTDSFHGPATDYGTLEPGLVPWQMLRSATWLLIMLWCVGPLLSFHCVGGPLEYGLAPLAFEDAQEANTDRIMKWNPAQLAFSAVAGSAVPGWMPRLEKGMEVNVQWPRRNSFTPKSMSSDPTGKQLVVADDFGLYKASLDFDGDVIKGSFSRAPPCTVFEGQLLKDIGVVCFGGSSDCRILVLHENGHKISECPLHTEQEDTPDSVQNLFKTSESGDHSASQTHKGGVGDSSVLRGRGRNLIAQAVLNHKAAKTRVSAVVTWKIAGQWLDAKKEHVQSMAINKFDKNCLVRSSDSDRGQGAQPGAFLPKGPGCIVVGTSSGRVIGLRRHVTESLELVPEINMQHRTHSVVQGSLRIMFNGIIMAFRKGSETLEALNMKTGSKLGEWRLPQGINWISLCGAGEYVFILGRDVSSKERRVVLWRFPLPPELLLKGNSEAPHDMTQEV